MTGMTKDTHLVRLGLAVLLASPLPSAVAQDEIEPVELQAEALVEADAGTEEAEAGAKA